ncbi:MAG: DUF5329 family protein [Acidobacteriota bacterium]
MRRSVVSAVLFLAAAGVFAATRPEVEQRRIDFLLDAVRHANAVFIRNDAEHPPAKAASHLKFKLFMAGEKVQTARDFIEGVATRSEETGRPYLIRVAGGKPQPLRDWLTARLKEHESAAAAVTPATTPTAR